MRVKLMHRVNRQKCNRRKCNLHLHLLHLRRPHSRLKLRLQHRRESKLQVHRAKPHPNRQIKVPREASPRA